MSGEPAQKKSPVISIGVPVYNTERFIGEALDSLLAQTFTDFEIVISDNTSTDRTGRDLPGIRLA
ncbi:MAG: glycosyltransferase [Betaproteobacteria bacterium]|nr:glycosyltransferase [Betaproteobacteria bacterium]